MSKSERWSSASSDSDVSFVLFGGEQRGELQGSFAIHDILREKIAFLSGGKDRRGGSVITIPTRGSGAELKTDDLKRLLTYLASLPSDHAKDQGFSILVDMRGSTWISIKPVLKSLQECFPSRIHSVYIIKPEGFWERHKASSGSGKFNFEVAFTSLEGLRKHIDPSNLTKDFGGTLSYDHDQWVIMQMALEKFNFEAMSLLTKLEEIHEGLIHQEYSDNLVGLREQLKQNQHVRKWIIKAPIETLQEEGQKLLGWINVNKISQNGETVNQDWVASSTRIKHVLESLHGKREKLKESWHARKRRLEKCVQYHLFLLDSEKLRQWINESQDDLVANFSEVGCDGHTAAELELEHQNIQVSCTTISDDIKKILEGADKLLQSGHYEADDIETIAASLEQEWKQFAMDIKGRGNLLSCSVSFHKKSEEFLRHVRTWQDQMHDDRFSTVTDLEQLGELLKNEGNLKKEIDSSYEAVSLESKQLLEALQKPMFTGDNRDTPEYSEASSHVMELLLNVHEHHRQLGLSWDSKQAALREQIHLLNLDHDVAQVIKWIDEHGEPFLTKHTDVGITAEKAEALLKRHEEFETIVENTYTNADQIRVAIHELEKSGECRPDEVKKRTQYFDRRVQDFIKRVNERRRILEKAVSFYSQTQTINGLVDKVKAKLEIEELSDDPDDIAKVLLRLRHDCERMLESINQNINDGRSILEHVKQGTVQDTEDLGSCEHLDKIIADLEAKKNVLEMAWMRRREQMELWQQLWEFERDGERVKNHLENCEAELENGGLADDLNGAKQMLGTFKEQLKEIDSLSLRTFCKGEELIDLLRHSDVELRVRNPNTPETIDAHHHIQNLLEFLHNQRSSFLAFAENRGKKLEHRQALKQLEADTRQAIGCIRNGENMLLSNIIPGYSLAEAQDSIKEYDQFKTAMEKTKQRVESIRSRAEKLIKQNHPEPEQVKNNSELVLKRWQQLMKKAVERHQVVMASYNFFKTSEEVSSLLQKVLKDYKIADDPCSQYADLGLHDRCTYITSLLEKHAKEREEITKGHNAVYGFADSFLKNVSPSSESETGVVPGDGSREKMEQQVKEISELIRGQKKFALDLWNVKNTVLGQCKEYLDFETSAVEALEWIQNHGEYYLNSKSSDSHENEDEAKIRYDEHKKFTEMSEEIKEKVKCLLQDADELYKRSCFHSDGIMHWATAVDKRFKDFASRMTKYLNQLEHKLGFSITKHSENDEEMPDVSVLSQTQANQQNLTIREKTLNLRELSKDSGIHELMEEEKRKSARRKEFIMNELLHTERTYVADLKCIIQNYMEMMDGNAALPPGLVGKEDVIFGNMREIYEFHNSVFLSALEKYETHPEDVGECFAERVDQFRMYVFYCKNKPMSNNLLIEHGGTFFSDLQASYNHGLSIAAYLIKPVQRITKYQLLLKDLLSCCEGSEKSLEAGLDVMLSVPRQANDEMSISLIRGYDDNIDFLGRIVLQDVFVILDPKVLRLKNKERQRHLFLFEQALLVTKEMKDSDGKVVYFYKYKLKSSELGVTEHIEADSCKFAIWTGLPPNSEVDKKIIKANTLDVKQNWVKQLRVLQQKFQFGELRNKTMSSCLRKDEKNPDRESGVVDDGVSWDFEFGEKGYDYSTSETSYCSLENYHAVSEDEVSLKKGQLVEIIDSPIHSPRWKIRFVTRDSDPQTKEGWVPMDALRRQEEPRKRRNSDGEGSLCSSEDSNSLSSCNDLSPVASLYNSPGVVNGVSASPPPMRRRVKSNGQFGTLRGMKPWRRESMKSKTSKSPQASPVPRNTRISGGGSKKLQALLGASENDIDLLIKTNTTTPPSAGFTKPSESLEEEVVVPEITRSQGIDRDDKENEGSIHTESEESLLSSEGLKESNESLLEDEEKSNGLYDEGKDEPSEEDKEAVALKKRMYVIKELIHTEQDYVKDLEAVVQGYLPEMSKDDIPEELRGKEREIFGNMKQILEWHKSFFCKELEKCEDAPERIGSVFLKAAKRLEMYIHYCQKKPKSEGLVREFEDSFFLDLKTRLGHRLALSDYLIKPVQRIMKYQLLLKDILKYTERANLESTELKNALEIMKIIPKKANDMMNVGMLEGYGGNLKAQGDLILQDILQVTDAKNKTKPAKRRVFVFEQMVIFSEPFERKENWTVFIYRHSIKTNFMGVTESVADDPCKFAIWTTKSSPSEIYVLKADTPEDKIKWIKTLKQLLEHLKQFANALVNPIEYQGGNSDPLSPNNFTSSEGQVTSSAVTEENSRNNSLSPSVVVRRHSSVAKTFSSPVGKQVRHFSLIPLDTAKTLEGLTGAFSEDRGKERYVAIDDHKAKAKDQISVKKGDIFYVVSSKKRDKKWLYGHVAGGETLGLVPARVLNKEHDENHVVDDLFPSGVDKMKLSRKHSFPNRAIRRVTVKKTKDEFLDQMSTKLKNNIEKYQQGVSLSDVDLRNSILETDELCNSNRVNETSQMKISSIQQLRDVVVDRPDVLRLYCEVVGQPKPTFQWEKDSKLLQESARVTITEEGFVSTLEVTKSDFEDSGLYTCTAVNDFGRVSTSCIARVRDKPSSPSRPTITEITSSSVIVKWQAPDSDGNSPITAYTVECKETGVSHWQAPVPFVSTTSTVVDDLNPGSVYQFRVSANNVVGISKPSPPTDPVTLGVGNGKSPRDCGKDAVTWRRNIDEFHNVYAELGRGRFSVVKKCVDKISGKEYAAKFIKKRMCSKHDVEREVLILRRLKHPNLNVIVDSFENDKNWILVMELLPSGRLFDSIVVASPWTEKEAVGFVKQILEAVQHLHDCRVAHLDLKPENVLLDGGPIPKVKLVDFGNAFTMSNENIIPDLLGNPEFSAPELIRGLPVSVETDVWSIGVIVHVMLTGVSPFYDEHLQTMCDNIIKVHCELEADYMSTISHEARDFIKRLLIREQWRRPECSDCLDMRWMKMISSRSPFPVPIVRLNTSRLASFNARRRKNQHEVTNIRPLLLTEKGESNV